MKRIGILALCLAAALAGCAKKQAPSRIEPSASEPPKSEPRELVRGFASEGSFTEPEAGSRFSLAVAGAASCPPVGVRGALACASGGRIVILERDGTDRSISLPGRAREILCSYEAGDKASLVILMEDGGLVSLDYESLTVTARAVGSGDATACAVSGLRIVRASGKKLERLSIPALSVEESAEAPAAVRRIAANGGLCLLLCGGTSLDKAAFIDSGDLAGGLGAVSDSADEPGKAQALWLGPLGAGFVALLSDGRAAFLAKGSDPEYLPGSFESDLDGCASNDRIALIRSDGRLCGLGAASDGTIQASDSEFPAELAMPVEGGWLWYSGGGIGYARLGGAPLWLMATAIAARFPPVLWNGRIVLCGPDGVELFPGYRDQGLDRSIRDALIPEEAEKAIAETLATMRAFPADGNGLDVAPYRRGARAGFERGWRVRVFAPEKSLSFRLAVKGPGEYFIAVFDEDGTKTLSNVGYGLEDSLELSLMQGKKYAIAYAPKDAGHDGAEAELTIQAR